MSPRSGIRAGVHCLWSDSVGQTEEPTLVFLHGAGGSARHWREVIDRLPRTTPVIAVDLPGHGDSPGPVPGTIDAATQLVADCVAALGVAGPIVVVAHSIGGLIALTWALRQPGQVTGLVLVATAARIRPHPVLLSGLRDGTVDEEFLRGAFADDVTDERFRLVCDDLRRVRLDPTVADFMNAGQLDLGPRLAEIRGRCLVLLSADDLVMAPRRSRALAAGIAGARIATIAGGHYLNVERPDAVAEHVRDLIRQQPATRLAMK